MEQAIELKDPNGHAVAGILSTPDQGTNRLAILCHGFLSSKDSTTNKSLTRLLLNRGIGTFRFDFFGHGESGGPFEALTVELALQQALCAIEYFTVRGYSNIGLTGSSFGGLIALLAAAQTSTLACLALKCPVVDFPEELRLELGEEGMQRWKQTDTIPNFTGGPEPIKLSYAFYEDSLSHVGYTAAQAIAAPTLIVQGGKDELIPRHQSQQFHNLLKVEKSLHVLPEADHQFTKREDFNAMIGLVSEWLITHLTPSTT